MSYIRWIPPPPRPDPTPPRPAWKGPVAAIGLAVVLLLGAAAAGRFGLLGGETRVGYALMRSTH